MISVYISWLVVQISVSIIFIIQQNLVEIIIEEIVLGKARLLGHFFRSLLFSGGALGYCFSGDGCDTFDLIIFFEQNFFGGVLGLYHFKIVCVQSF